MNQGASIGPGEGASSPPRAPAGAGTLPSDPPGAESASHRDNIHYSLSRTIAGQALALLRSFAVLPLISPGAFGAYRYVMTLMSYLSVLHLGSLDYLLINYPKRYAAGDREEAQRVVARSWNMILWSSAIGVVVFAVLVSLQGIVGLPLLVVLCVLALCHLPAQYVSVWYRVHLNFRRGATLEMLAGLFGFLGVAMGTVFFGFSGLLVGALVASPMLLFVGRSALFPPGWRLVRWRELGGSVRASARLWSINVSSEVASSFDFVLLAFLFAPGTALLGFYGLGVTLLAKVSSVANSLAQVELVYISRDAGRSEDVDEIARRVLRAAARDGLFSVLLAGATAALMFAILIPLLPKYQGAVVALGPILGFSVFRRWRKYSLVLTQLCGRVMPIHVVLGFAVLLIAAGFAVLAASDDDQLFHYALWAFASEMTTGVISIFVALRTMGCAHRAGPWLMRCGIALLPMMGLVLVGGFIESPFVLAAVAAASALATLGAHRILVPEAVAEVVAFIGNFWRKTLGRRGAKSTSS